MPDMVVRWPAGWRVERVNGRLEVRNAAGTLEAYSDADPVGVLRVWRASAVGREAMRQSA